MGRDVKAALACLVFFAWGIPAIFLVLIPAEFAALACLIAGRPAAANACMEWGGAVMVGERGPVAPLFRLLDRRPPCK